MGNVYSPFSVVINESQTACSGDHNCPHMGLSTCSGLIANFIHLLSQDDQHFCDRKFVNLSRRQAHAPMDIRWEPQVGCVLPQQALSPGSGERVPV